MTHALSLNCTLVILSCTPLLAAVHRVLLYLRSELSGNTGRGSNLREYPFLKLYTLVVVLLDAKRIRATASAYNLRLGADSAPRRPSTLSFLHICDDS